MPQKQQIYHAIIALLFSLIAFLPGSASAALPPIIDAKPLFGDVLVQGRWQPIVVTITNQDTGDALTGEVKTSLVDSRTGEVSSSVIAPVTLPRGAGTVRTTATVFVPENDQPDITVSLQQGRDGRGATITRRSFDKQRFVSSSLTLIAVTTLPDAISYLRGEKLGVENTTGALRPIEIKPSPKSQNQNYGQRADAAAAEVRVENITEAGQLPQTASGYDTIGIVYVGQDIGPGQFSDSQVSALRGWVAGGGLLVIGSPSLRADERFRTWIPVPGQAGTARIEAGKARIGRGLAASVGGDLTETGFGKSAAALVFWRNLARDACSEPLAGNLIQSRGLRYYYSPQDFWQSVVRAPGLKAPPSSAIALFLLAYLLLLVPINYLILKRLDRREWTWATVPILVTLFSVGAYVFGYAVKGTRMLQNTITLCEMGANRGEAVVTASVGVFSPRQTKYDLSTSLRDTLFWSPQAGGRYNRSPQEYGPMEVVTPGATGGDSAVHVRNADISMWAMRVFAARTYQVKMGNGIAAILTQDGDQITGTVTNNTTRSLEQASLYFGGGRTDIGSLAPGARQTISLRLPPRMKGKASAYRGRQLSSGTFPNPRLREFQSPVLSSIDSALESFNQREQEQGNFRGDQNKALLLAWNQDEIFPIKIDGQPVPTGTNLNLITVAIPVGAK